MDPITTAIASVGKLFTVGGAATAGTAAATAGTAAGAAAGTAASTAATTGLLSSATAGQLLGGLTALKVIGGIGAGRAASIQSNQAANEADLSAGQEDVAARQRQTRIAREMARVMGQNETSYAAAGVDITQGIAQNQNQDARQQAMEDITIDQRDTDFRKSMYRQRATAYRQKARSDVGGALIGALGDVAAYGLTMKVRG